MVTKGHVMFGRRKRIQELNPPPIATSNPEAVEVLRVWAAPGSPRQVTLWPGWRKPGTWGLMLVDVARHAARAYKRDGHDPDEVLQRIREFFDAEWSSPTSPIEEL
jgi:hypothetical protein